MTNPSYQSYTGTTTCDISPIAALLVLLASDSIPVIRTEMPGVDDAITELNKNLAGHAASIELGPSVAQKLASYNTALTQIKAARKDLEEMLLTITHTQAKVVHDREVLIARIAKAAKAAANSGDPSLLTPFKATVAYNGQVAEKAAKTRRKNQEAEAQGLPVAPSKKSKKAAAKKAAPRVEALQPEAPEAEAPGDEDTPPPSLRAA